jgi:hypothetical protein
MAPIVKSHELKNGFVQMKNLDETTGLRFFLHNNKLADKPILLFPQGMVTLIRALRKAYEIYDEQVLQAAAAGDLPVVNEVVFSVTIATSKVVQGTLEISVYQEKLYSFLKKLSWSEEEGIWKPCRGAILLDRHQDDPDSLLQFAMFFIISFFCQHCTFFLASIK